MIIDNSLVLFDRHAVAGAPGTDESLGYPLAELGKSRREGLGEPMEIIVMVVEDCIGGTNIDFRYLSADNADLTGGTVQRGTSPVPAAQLVAGYRVKIPLPFPLEDVDATHIGVQLNKGGTFTDGEVQAWIQRAGEDQDNPAYPSGS